MKIFISWSGRRSLAMATALREWLPATLQYVEPFMSEEDIEKGSRWSAEIAAELETCNYGIICVTRSNMASQWLCFEAGAISKVVKDSRVAPLASDLSPAEITGPLSLFQATRQSHEDVSRLLRGINVSAESEAIAESAVNKALDKWWPDLNEAWDKALEVEEATASEEAKRSDRDILEEILSHVRNEQRAFSFGSLVTGVPLGDWPSIAPATVQATLPGRRRRRVPDTSDAQTVRILKQRLSEALQVPAGDVTFVVHGGRIIVSLPYDPTEDQQRAAAEWAAPFRLDVSVQGPAAALSSLLDFPVIVPEEPKEPELPPDA